MVKKSINILIFLFIFSLYFVSFLLIYDTFRQRKLENLEANAIDAFDKQVKVKKVTVDNIDDGNTIDYYRDNNGKKAHFKTPAAALTYFKSLGWELVSLGTDNISPLTYWVFKKPVSKEEYDKIVNNAINSNPIAK